MGPRVVDWDLIAAAWESAALQAIAGASAVASTDPIYAAAFWLFYGDREQILVPALAIDTEGHAAIENRRNDFSTRWAPAEWRWLTTGVRREVLARRGPSHVASAFVSVVLRDRDGDAERERWIAGASTPKACASTQTCSSPGGLIGTGLTGHRSERRRAAGPMPAQRTAKVRRTFSARRSRASSRSGSPCALTR